MSTENNLKYCPFCVGNAAAMREALIEWCTYAAACIDVGVFDRAHMNELVVKGRTALAAPPRNCDVYADAQQAWQAWLDDKDNWDDFGSSKLELHEWLFAPVTKKGE